MKARLYLQPCFFSCARVFGFRPHTDPTDLTGFARLMVNLTEVLHTHASSGSHRFNVIQQK